MATKVLNIGLDRLVGTGERFTAQRPKSIDNQAFVGIFTNESNNSAARAEAIFTNL